MVHLLSKVRQNMTVATTVKTKTLKKLISLDEERARATIKLAMGKWGAGFVLNACAEIYDAMVGLEQAECCDKHNAAVRSKLLRALADSLFNCAIEERNCEQEIHDSERVVEIKSGGNAGEQKGDGQESHDT